MIYRNVELHNVAEVRELGSGRVGITRVPENLRMTLNESAKRWALAPAGCEIRFNLKSEKARIVLAASEPDSGIAEVYQGNFLVSWHLVSQEPTSIEIALPGDLEQLKQLRREKNLPFCPGLTRIILPYRMTLEIVDIAGEFELPERNQVPARRYLAYGSSITHGATSIRSTGTYAMRTAELLGVDLFNMGFGGGAHCESQLADYLAERKDWDFASLEMGINMLMDFAAEEFEKRVRYFVSTIAKAHPDKWIFCIDMFTFEQLGLRKDKEDSFRKIVKKTVAELDRPKVIYLDGRKLLPKVSGLTLDLVHPAPGGMEEIARNLSSIISSAFTSRVHLSDRQED